MEATVAAGLVVLVVLLILIFQHQSRHSMLDKEPLPNASTHLVHRMCPHNNVVQSFRVEQKDSLDEHLDILTKKLAEKEGRLRLSKSKIRETQHELESLHAIDEDVRRKYRNVMEALREDLVESERECRRLQSQIEWVSRRRAEIRDEVSQGQKLYVEAAAELATNLTEMHRGRPDRITDKPQTHQGSEYSLTCLRQRKEPQLPSALSPSSIGIKAPLLSPETNRSYADIANE